MPTRREFLSASAAVLLSNLPTGCTHAQTTQNSELKTQNSKPNILLILGDDHTFSDCSFAGNHDVSTPNIDRLAKQSLRFTNAHTCSAMCVPSRSMLYTGLYPLKNGAHPNHSFIYPNVKSIATYLKDLGYRVALAGKVHVAPREQFAFEYLDATEAAVEKFITRKSHDTEPFCLIYASHHPHAPWAKSKIDPAKLALPPNFIDTPEARQALANYYHEINELDKEVGMCLDLLDKHKLAENTLTIYTSEQGAPFPHGKWTCYEEGLHVQFIARWPGHIKADSISDALISYADFVPTAIDLAGGTPPPGLDGKSLLPLFAGKSVELHDAVFGIQTTRGIISGSDCYPIRSIRTKTHKYIWNLEPDATFQNIVCAPRPIDAKAGPNFWQSWVEKAKTDPAAKKIVDAYQHRPEEELYDLTTDPHEQHNLAQDPKYAELKADLRKRLEAFMKDQNDKGIESEMDAKNRQSKSREE